MAVGTVSGISRDNWQLIETITVSGNPTAVTSSVTLTGYSKLMTTSSITIGAGDILSLQFNGDTGANYFSSLTSGSGANNQQNKISTRVYSASGVQNAIVVINYANLSAPKIVDILGNSGVANGGWLTANAITSITFASESGNQINSGTIKIYGIAG